MTAIAKSTHALVAAAATLACFCGSAQATLINMEDIAVAVGANIISGDRVSQGFNFDSSTDHTHLVHDTGGVDAWNGTTTLQTDDNSGAATLRMSKVGGGAFSLGSLQLGEGFASAGQGATTVHIVGNLPGGGTITMDVLMDGIFDQGGPLNDFQTVSFGAGWGTLSSVDFSATAGPSIRVFLLDNIEVGAAVPVPGTIALVLGGLAALRVSRRRA